MSDCYQPRVGGIEMQVHDLAQHQAAAGHEVTVVTSTVGPSTDPWTVTRPLNPAGRGGTILYRRSSAGRAAVRDRRIDAVHIHASAFSPLAFLAAHSASREGRPTVVTLHSLWGWATPLFRAADAITGWTDWPVRWTAVSAAAAAPLRQVLGPGPSVAILPNGIDCGQWVRARPPADSGEVRLVAVMRLTRRKRPLPLLVMLDGLRRRVPPDVRLAVDIVGEGPERGRMGRYLARHSMGDWVRLRGQLSRPEIRELYADSDLFLAPAALESFGIAALEARCAGLPVVARSGTGIQEFVANGTDGLLVDSDAEFVDAMSMLVRSRWLRRRLGRSGLEAPPGVSWAEVVDTCDRLYGDAERLQRGRAPEPRSAPGAAGPEHAAAPVRGPDPRAAASASDGRSRVIQGVG